MQRFCVSMGVAALFSIEAHARHGFYRCASRL